MNDDVAYLIDIQNAIARIQSYTTGGPSEFHKNTLIQDGVLRNLETIGEAVKNLSAELRNESPHVPWKSIAGLRDILIHRYFDVNFNQVWGVVDKHLPPLSAAIKDLLVSRAGDFDPSDA